MFARTRMIAGLSVLFAGTLRAQTPAAEPAKEPTEQVPAAAERPVTVKLHVNGEFGFETNLSGAPGKVTVTRGGGDVDVGIPVLQYCQLNLGFEYEHSNYDFHGATGFISGVSSPFDSVNRETFSARFAQHLSQEWQYVVGGRLLITAEDGADVGDSIEGVFFAAPQYRVNERLSIGLGVAVSTRLEDNALVVPLVTVDWDISEHWNLSSKGLGAALTYTPNERWAFSLSGEWQYRDFRLDKNGALPGGVGRETRVPVTLAAEWTPDKRITAQAGFGVAFGQNYELLDSGGNSVASIDADAAPFFMMRLGFKF